MWSAVETGDRAYSFFILFFCGHVIWLEGESNLRLLRCLDTYG
jgi:hypothetical protein